MDLVLFLGTVIFAICWHAISLCSLQIIVERAIYTTEAMMFAFEFLICPGRDSVGTHPI